MYYNFPEVAIIYIQNGEKYRTYTCSSSVITRAVCVATALVTMWQSVAEQGGEAKVVNSERGMNISSHCD